MVYWQVTMENQEEILDALNDFEKKPCVDIPPLLEQYLGRIAKTGKTLFPWHRLKPLFINKLEQVMTKFNQELPADHLLSCPNVENVKYDEMQQRIVKAVNDFPGAPFTIQRLCELLTEPEKHYKRCDKFLRGIEKNVLVISTVDPFGNKIVSESRNLVNGLDSPSLNGSQFTSLQPGQYSSFPVSQPANWPTDSWAGVAADGDNQNRGETHNKMVPKKEEDFNGSPTQNELGIPLNKTAQPSISVQKENTIDDFNINSDEENHTRFVKDTCDSEVTPESNTDSVIKSGETDVTSKSCAETSDGVQVSSQGISSQESVQNKEEQGDISANLISEGKVEDSDPRDPLSSDSECSSDSQTSDTSDSKEPVTGEPDLQKEPENDKEGTEVTSSAETEQSEHTDQQINQSVVEQNDTSENSKSPPPPSSSSSSSEEESKCTDNSNDQQLQEATKITDASESTCSDSNHLSVDTDIAMTSVDSTTKDIENSSENEMVTSERESEETPMEED